MHSYLIVQADQPVSTDSAVASSADVLVLDFVGAGASAFAPLLGARGPMAGSRFVAGVGLIDGPTIDEELSAAMRIVPDAIMLPVRHGHDITHLGARLAVYEAEAGLPDRSTRIVGLVATAAGALNAKSFVGASERLAGLAWDAGAIAKELRACPLDEAGGWSAPLAAARGLVRLAAAAAGVGAIEATYPGGEDGFGRHLAAARRDGFDAVVAASFAQIPFIQEA